MNIKNKFTKWLIENKVYTKEDNIDNDLKLLEELSCMMIENNEIEKEIFEIKKYDDAKKLANLYFNSKKGKYFRNSFKYGQCLELINLYLKFQYTIFEKKYSIDDEISYFNNCCKDISDIFEVSQIIFNELLKWPYVYTILDSNNKYATIMLGSEYKIVCIPIYTNKKFIDSTYLNDSYMIKKERLNHFLRKIDNDTVSHGAMIVLNPENSFNNVLIDREQLFWYYYPQIGNMID